MLVCSFFCGNAKYKEKPAADRPSEIQWAPTSRPQIDQVAPKVLHKSARASPPRSRLLRSPLFGPNFLIYFGRPLADFRCPFGTLSVPIGFFCNIKDSSPPDSARFCQYLAINRLPPTASVKRCRRSPRSTMGPKIDQVAPQLPNQNYLAGIVFCFEKAPIRAETPSGLDLRFSIFLVLCIFQF